MNFKQDVEGDGAVGVGMDCLWATGSCAGGYSGPWDAKASLEKAPDEETWK